jgi:hypothetical protein
LVPVTVYVVVTVGDAVTVAPVEELSDAAGAQVYVSAPLAVRLMLLPLQIVEFPGVMVTVGEVPIETVTVVVAVQPALFVPVMVYVVVTVGLAVTVAPVVALSPVAGDHA